MRAYQSAALGGALLWVFASANGRIKMGGRDTALPLTSKNWVKHAKLHSSLSLEPKRLASKLLFAYPTPPSRSSSLTNRVEA